MSELRLENSIVDDRYLIERCLSRSCYAEIFLARDVLTAEQPVIIKALNTGLQCTPDPDLEQTLIQNFQNEAVALDKVCHPNIIRRLGHGTAADLEGRPFHYLVFEYMPGGDLLALCRAHHFDLDDVLFYFGQVAAALAFAHSRNVIHRDIKPTNLLLSRDHRIVKVADFGVAKIDVDDSAEITRVGTYTYAAPEHHPDGQGENPSERLTPSADVYSLAKTIYTALTGRAPHSFARRPITELPDPLTRQPWSAELAAILRKATATTPTGRYQSVDEFWQSMLQLKNAETDGEATVVRARPPEREAADAAMPAPAFESAGAFAGPKKARIVIELPERQAEGASNGAHSLDRQPGPLAPTSSAKTGAESRVQKAQRATVAFARNISWRDLLRRFVIIFAIAAFAGVVASVYYNFADPQNQRTLRRLLPVFGGSLGEGSVSGAANVNLRSEPNGNVLAWLPAGSRVRVEESRGGWLKVRVLEWNGSRPDDAPESGWIDRRYVQLD